MANFKKSFELSLKDIDVIETALRTAYAKNEGSPTDAKNIQNVLGKLHNQKMFYRPKNKAYVSG